MPRPIDHFEFVHAGVRSAIDDLYETNGRQMADAQVLAAGLGDVDSEGDAVERTLGQPNGRSWSRSAAFFVGDEVQAQGGDFFGCQRVHMVKA